MPWQKLLVMSIGLVAGLGITLYTLASFPGATIFSNKAILLLGLAFAVPILLTQLMTATSSLGLFL